MSPPRQFGTEFPMLAMGERALISPTCSVLVFRPSSKTQSVQLDRLTVVIKIRLEWVLRGWTGKLHNRNWERNIVTEAGSKARTACVVDKVQAIWGQRAWEVCLRSVDGKARSCSGQQASVFASHHTATCHCSMAKHSKGGWMAAKCLL